MPFSRAREQGEQSHVGQCRGPKNTTKLNSETSEKYLEKAILCVLQVVSSLERAPDPYTEQTDESVQENEDGVKHEKS